MNYKFVNVRSILDKVKQICEDNIVKDDIVVDMTVGNGNDTLMLCNLAKFVFGFDIQSLAICNAKKLLNENNVSNYKLILDSHEKIDYYLAEYKNKIKLVIFNLGYLPKGDKSIITNHTSTLNAFIKSYNIIKDNGLILIVFYPHDEGKQEAIFIKEYLMKNKINFNEYHNTDNINAPFLVAVKKQH